MYGHLLILLEWRCIYSLSTSALCSTSPLSDSYSKVQQVLDYVFAPCSDWAKAILRLGDYQRETVAGSRDED